MAGGRLFPGVQHHAAFTVVETGDYLSVALISDDGQTRIGEFARFQGAELVATSHDLRACLCGAADDIQWNVILRLARRL
jgi:hypothetical protein